MGLHPFISDMDNHGKRISFQMPVRAGRYSFANMRVLVLYLRQHPCPVSFRNAVFH